MRLHIRDSAAGGADRDGVVELRVGLVADPGRPAKVAGALAGELAEALAANVSGAARWRVEVVREALPLDETGIVPIVELGAERRDRNGWDLVVYLTDLPRRSGTQPVVADISSGHAVALVSLPAVGWVRLRPHVRDTLVYVIRRLVGTQPGVLRDTRTVYAGDDSAEAAERRRRVLPRRPTELVSLVRETRSFQPGIDVSLVLVGMRGRVRLLFGMVRDNQPWLLVPHLSRATAAAAATAAFGIFYSTIWSLAESLPSWRLGLIAALAIGAMAGWLLVYNHLWDPPAGHHTPAETALYNIATVVTLLLGVTCMYVVLYALALAAAAAVIDANYLESVVSHRVGIGDYATLVWLASSMGIVAGALGSSLDTEEAIRRATYSRREQERQARARRPGGPETLVLTDGGGLNFRGAAA
jgi:hypothetical protein